MKTLPNKITGAKVAGASGFIRLVRSRFPSQSALTATSLSSITPETISYALEILPLKVRGIC